MFIAGIRRRTPKFNNKSLKIRKTKGKSMDSNFIIRLLYQNDKKIYGKRLLPPERIETATELKSDCFQVEHVEAEAVGVKMRRKRIWMEKKHLQPSDWSGLG